MSLSRRKTLALLGGGSILAATGAGAYAVTRMPRTALEPWAQAGSYAEPRMRALSYAILAPNPHNRQPWQVDLRKDGEVTLRVDTDRLLPHTDPFSRQITIGLGCFLELMTLAAAEQGYGVDLDLFPDGEDPTTLDTRRVAVARFTEGTGIAAPDLFGQVMQRRSLKEPFDTEQTVDQATLDEVLGVATLSQVAGSVVPRDIAELRALSHEALRIEIETPHTYKESVDLFRIGRREVDASPDGIDFTGPMFEAMALTGTFTREGALDRSSMAYTEGLKAVFANTDTAMGHLWQVTPTNTRADQIAAGRDWLRLNLAATKVGLGMQPLSQALQEYPEMSALYTEVHDRLAPEGGTVQMFARIGYGPDIAQSPRWDVESKIVHA
ncbi:Acg family FMN-binding oxidoreductase [Tateyamaria omphalii]|uniref:Twin-arginine translocation pathway signal protein n=1 Tax=Tateyamaria omphalii TaxID=299262 RepID=A0A1P8MS84_9RHOB|nr:twin-arginine translocation pathway signal protein [Tateyamaria omphalii]APX10872.1 twin-arginine translocation pathway signal protein [Tateyamaria omphalii]